MVNIITLTTDFGLTDAYVGIMKGVILGINPQARIVDIWHDVEPQNVAKAAFLLSTAWEYFPVGTIHVVVVDPGVGGNRRAVLLVTPKAYFVAPDNGVLSYILEEASEGSHPQAEFFKPFRRSLPAGLEAVVLSNPRFWQQPISFTFHGRDVFAPVAAHLSLGVSPKELGEPTDVLLAFHLPHPEPTPQGTLIGHILHIDRFGNLITDLKVKDLPEGNLLFEVAGERIQGISRCYEGGGELLAIVGSSGRLEIAVKNGSAAAKLKATVGQGVTVRIDKCG